MPEKIVLIGAGSAMFTIGVVSDLVKSGEPVELALVDIDPAALEVAQKLVEKMIAACQAPIHLSAAFVFPDSDHAAALFNMERSGHVYSRISNPTVAVLEERMASLEQGVGAIEIGRAHV